MRRISTGTYFIGAVATSASIFISWGLYHYSYRFQKLFRDQEFYIKGLHIFSKYPTAKEILGEPITPLRLDLQNYDENHTDGRVAQLKVPLRGPKDKGFLYITASRGDHLDDWVIDELDFEVTSKKQRWTFYTANNQP